MNNQNKSFSLRRMTIAALFMALITILTAFVPIPIPGGHGYIHPGDGMIYACAWAIGGPIAGIAAGLGSALADILIGWSQYAPATLIIKFIMGLVCYLIMKAFKYKTITNVFAMIVAAIIMVIGYAVFEYFIAGIGGATATLFLNSIQAVGGVIIGTVLIFALDNIKALDPFIIWKAKKSDE